jgi:cell wall-associated NlpC family hydrolase
MTPDAFLARALALPGLPWVRWRAEWDGADCFGLVVLWHREVLGLDLGAVPTTDIGAGFAAATGWQPCSPVPGATAWMAWRGGAPAHCGILAAPGMVLHSDGDQGRPGVARLTRLSVMQRLYSDLQFFRRAEVAPC